MQPPQMVGFKLALLLTSLLEKPCRSPILYMPNKYTKKQSTQLGQVFFGVIETSERFTNIESGTRQMKCRITQTEMRNKSNMTFLTKKSFWCDQASCTYVKIR